MTDALTVDDLSVRLGEREVLSDVSFSLPAGAMLAVLGPNGGGKSTLLQTLVGLRQPSAGHFRILDRELAAVPPGMVGYVPQIKSMDRVFPAQALDLVVSAHRGRWPGRITASDREVAMRALGEVGAQHLAHRPIGALSGGELQRVYLARAVSRSPGVLLLDEPEAGVDAVGTADFHSLLDRYRAAHGTTIVLVTHDWDAARYHASHVLLLRTRMVAFGPSPEAFGEEPLRQAFGHVGHAHGTRTGGRPA